ncbi:MAG: isoleucine--tRNA ligase [Desulfurococcales archaeon]|nr:isoleucine--tRNA ligase [Desulfurococcales archaeon]
MPVVGKLEGYYIPHDVEEWVKKFWRENKIYDLIKEENSRKEKTFLFIDGPPYPSGDIPHIGTAWNKSLKDLILRFKRMQGYRVYDKPGYDCHGLPIEVKVEQRLGIRVKKEIEERVGVEKFIGECKKFALNNIKSMTRWFQELGVFMDWENPYLTLRDDYIEAGWWLIKKAYERGLVDNEYRVVYWCPRCSTTLAEYEIEYHELEDPSIYVKFPIKGKDKEYLLIWTTTPWTLPSNMFVMAHPEAIYVKVRVGDETYVLAKARLEAVMKEAGIKDYKIIDEFPGKDLENLEYKNPLEDILDLQKRVAKYHRIVMAQEFVTLYEGTGFVHSAPGHGFEDYIVAKRIGVDEIVSPVDDEGRFTSEVGKYAGKHVREANSEIIEDLRKLGALLYAGVIKHRYPVCWRCKTPVVLRATRQWILRVTRLKEKLVREAEKVNWIPKWALERLHHILDNLQDWVLSRQRYWGTPLPIWVCPNGHRVVIGSREELKKLSGVEPRELHKPWVDKITFKCPYCGLEMKRVPDVMDVWFDSGISFYATRGHPEKLDPKEIVVDFITEGHDQIRGWFFSLLRSGVIGFDKAPYRTVLVHGFALDEKGREMHKSLGNYVGTDEAIARAGRDPLRLWVLQNTVWEDLRFSWKYIDEVRRDLSIAWNVYVFASTYMNLDRFDPSKYTIEEYREHLRFEDKWILSRINKLVDKVTDALEKYYVHEAARELRRFIVEDVSRWYIRLIRPRVWVEENTPDKLAAYTTLYYVLKTWLVLAAPFIPFFTEKIYQEFIRKAEPDTPATIHLTTWPKPCKEYINEELEHAMEVIKEVYEASAAARMKAGIKLRQPVREVIVYTSDKAVEDIVTRYSDVVASVVNARKVSVKAAEEISRLLRYRVEPVYSKLGPVYKKLARKIIEYINANQDIIARDIISKGEHHVVIDGEDIVLTREYVKIIPVYIAGYSVVETDWGSIVIDTKLSREEIIDGLARDVVRRIQVMRKELDLPLDAKIEVYVLAPKEHIELLEQRRNYIAGETRADKLVFTSNENLLANVQGYKKEWEINGETYTIIIRSL